MKYGFAAIIAILLAGAGILWLANNNLKADLTAAEQSLSQMRIAFEQERQRSEALADNARRCLAREALAQSNAAERSAILAAAAEKERTPEEKEKVADDATRSAVINRLNRGLWH